MAPNPREPSTTPMVEDSNNNCNGATVSIGPDLNCSRPPLDKKLYRQILLPNGLRCLLIQDTVAMHQAAMHGGIYEGDDEDDDDDDVDEEENGSKIEDYNTNDAMDTDDEDEDGEDDDDGNDGLRDAAATILVGAGSMLDPPSCQGLAHFLEHLLFMGSDKYPGENDYESFVSKHGGTDNAWTEWEHTIYSLQIPQEHLWGALDRLAQFFIAPLLLETAVDRELLSIESEFQLNLLSDSCRWEQLICSTSKKDHPLCSFAWGNLKSLKEIPAKLNVDPLKEIRLFYDRYYYAANMRLVVMGAYTLDHMQTKIVQQFSSVPALPRVNDSTLPVVPEQIGSWNAEYRTPVAQAGFPLDHNRSLGKIFRIVPIKQRHSLSITWQIPPQTENWKSKPADYISHLMGHEASGSLLSYFRAKSWAVGCMVGVGEGGSERASTHALFTATFVLSEKMGLARWKEMVDAIYQYIGMLRMHSRKGWPEWIYEELRRVHELSYLYGDEPAPDHVVENLVDDMAPYLNLPPERLLDGSALLFEFDAVAVQDLLDNYLTPANARIDLTSSAFGKPCDYDHVESPIEDTETINHNYIVLEEPDDLNARFDISAFRPQIEPMFGTKFWCHALPSAWIQKWSELSQPKKPLIDVALPPQNPFVPQKFDLKALPEDDSDHPLLNSSVKVCITVGKTKQWFPATVVRYNSKKNTLLLSYEDEEEKWHVLDHVISDLKAERLIPDFEGTMDSKKVKFRLIALSIPGRGAVRLFGDESDMDVQDGISYPPIPPASTRLPKQIANTNALKMWWLQDRNFKRPIAEFRLQIICAKANSSPLHRMCADLMRDLCVDALIEMTYLAEMCELAFQISSSDVGFTVRLHGFDANLLDLFQKTMHVFFSFRGQTGSLPTTVKEDRFAACLEVLERKYRNHGMSAANLASTIRLEALRLTNWSSNKKLRHLKTINIRTFSETVSSIMRDMAVEAFYHGNVDRADADKARDLVLTILENSGGAGLSRKKYPPQTVVRIPSVKTPVLLTVPSKDPAEPNTACEVYVQVGKDNLRDRILMDLLVHMMDEPIYDQIRTKDQFGYSVHVNSRWTYGIIGCKIHVTTNVKSATETVDRIEKFLNDFRKELVGMSIDDYREHQVGLAKQKLDMFNSLSEETDCLWAEIRDGRFEWEAWRDEAICLRSITKDDALAAFDKWLYPGTKKRNICAIQVIGAGDTNAATGRPVVEVDGLGAYMDCQVEEFHNKVCKKQTWGRVNSKLF